MRNRPNVNIDEVATGEVWLGSEALQKGLIDDLMTSEELIRSYFPTRQVLLLKKAKKKKRAAADDGQSSVSGLSSSDGEGGAGSRVSRDPPLTQSLRRTKKRIRRNPAHVEILRGRPEEVGRGDRSEPEVEVTVGLAGRRLGVRMARLRVPEPGSRVGRGGRGGRGRRRRRCG